MLSGIRETLYPLSIPRATRGSTGSWDGTGSASFAGLTRLIVDNVFDAAAINHRLQA